MSNCICSSSEVMILPCSGAANVGQISNDASVAISKEGKGKMYCLAGVGGNVPGIIDAVKKADKRIVVDGCPVACAKKILENANLEIDSYILITENGIQKTPGKSEYSQEEMLKIKGLIEEKINE